MDAVTITVIVLIGTIVFIETINVIIKLPCATASDSFTGIIILSGNDNVELKLENILHKLKWVDKELINKIIIVDNGLDDEQLSLCKQYCFENSILEMANPDDTLNLIFSREKIM